MKRSTLITLIVVVAIAGLFFYMTTARASTTCEVCMSFDGRTNCATAVGPTEEDAREGAQTTACGPIASGMDQSIACGRTEPVSVRCRTR
ncbi:MAG TPA: hypothetical protein VLB49_00895 [Gemmatimonadales bacterium]|nr:hypothetical protein [Gemmatimonadales bacterium]